MSVAKHRLSSDIAQVDDLLLDGSDVYVYTRKPDDSTAILTNLRTGEEVTFAPERILAMKLIVPGAIIQTGGAPHHIVDIEDKHITFTAGDGEPQGMHAVFYADTLAAVRRRNYGPLGKQAPDADAALAAELDAAVDAVLDEAGVPDLDADAALGDFPDDGPSSRYTYAEDEGADDLPPADEEELPPGEPQPLPEKIQAWAPEARDWKDETVRVSVELITARQRIRQLEDELARLHDESRDTVPLAPETIRAAQGETDPFQFAELVVEPSHFKTKQMLLKPADLLHDPARSTRQHQLQDMVNDGWRISWQTAQVAVIDGMVCYLHTALLDKFIEDDDPRGDGQPEHRDILDQAREVLGEDDEPADQPEDADAEDLETETDLTPVEARMVVIGLDERGEPPVRAALPSIEDLDREAIRAGLEAAAAFRAVYPPIVVRPLLSEV